MKGEPVTYVQRQLGHASIQPTVDMYGKWLSMGNKAAVDRILEWRRPQSDGTATNCNAGADDWNRTNDLRFTKWSAS